MVEKAAAKNILREVAAKRATDDADCIQEDLEGAVQDAAGLLRTLLPSEKLWMKQPMQDAIMKFKYLPFFSSCSVYSIKLQLL